jgi:PAS domain S-box-containing protein
MRKILAIDDQKDNLTTIKAVIKSQLPDIEVLCALTGKEGIQTAKKEQPDTIILDIIMPEMDGYEVCKQLKSSISTQHIPIVMLTAIKTDADSRIKGLNLGADAFMSKPIDPLELATQLKVMLRIKAAEDKLRSDKVFLEDLVLERTHSLNESQKKYQALYDNAPLPYQSLNNDGTFKDINPAWLSTLGYTKEEIIGKYFRDLLHPVWQSNFDKNYPEFKNKGYINGVEFKIRHKKGHYLDISFEGCIGYNPDGSFNQTYCVFQDITERKQAELEKFESERRLNTLINNLQGIAYRCKNIPEWEMEYLSAGFKDLTGYKIEDVINSNKKKYSELIVPEDRGKIWDEIQEALSKRESFECIYKIRTASNELIYVQEKGVGIYSTENNEVIAIEGFINDITKQILSEKAIRDKEEYLRTILKAADKIGFITTVLDGKNNNILSFSSGAENIFGYRSIEIIKKNVNILFDDLILNKIPKLLYPSQSDKQNKTNEVILLHKNGEKFPGELTLHKLSNGKGITEGFLCVIVDITERKKSETALKESEELNRSITQSAADAIISINEKGIILSWNKAAENIFGYTSVEMVSNDLSTVLPEKYKTGHLMSLEKLNQINDREVLGSTMEISALRKNGDEFPIELSLSSWKTDRHKYYTGIIRDISDRKLAEKEITKLSSAVQQSPSVILITDTKGKIDYVNPKFTKLTGYSSDEAVGAKSNILKSGQQSDDVYSLLWDTIKEGREWRGEFENKKKNGEIFWESAAISPIFDKEGKITNYIKVAEDITEQKKAAKALKESEKKYQKLIATTLEGFWLIDTHSITLDVNPSLCEMLGYTKEEILGTSPFDYVDEENLKIFKDQISRSYSDKQRTYEISLRTKNGISVPTLFNATSITNEDDKFMGSFAFVTNTSESKHAAQIQKVLYNISNAVVTTENLNNFIGLVQKNLSQIIDTTNFYVALYNPDTNSLSLPFFTDEKDKIVSIPTGKSLTNYILKTKKSLLATHEDLEKLEREGEIESFGSDSKIWLGVPLKIEEQVIGVLVVQSYTDKTAFNNSDLKMMEFVSDQIGISLNRKRAEEELLTALQKAEESDELKTAFLQNISHEIRTPMNGILGFASLLKDTELTGDEQQSYIDVIMISGKRMLTTLNDLMDISKLETGQVQLNISDTNINEELEILYNFFELEVQKKGLQLSFHATLPSNEAIIASDREKLFATLSNLIKNSIKYCNDGEIDFGYVKKEETLEFFIKDTGIGIPKHRLNAIFDRFVQADIEDVKVYEGSGLGLSISKAYVEMLGGEIWVESSEGKGSEFYFTIPYNPVPTKRVNKNLKSNGISSTYKDNQTTILIAEDEEIASEYLSIVLEEIDHNLIKAKNGVETVDICLENNDIDIILMDMKMPIMDGYEATRKIREFNKDIIIIAQTAYALEGDREKAIDAGCNDYITKPIIKEKLFQMIEKYNSQD